MDKTCRICAGKSPNSISIFSFQSNRLISDMITLICPIKIDPLDSYPKAICKVCLRIISEAHDLRAKSIYSDIKFKTEELSISGCSKGIESQQSESPAAQKEPKLPEITNIKQENPYSSTIEFVDENYVPADEDNESNDEENYQNLCNEDDDDGDFVNEITPIEPMLEQGLKYDLINSSGMTKFRCKFCGKIFMHLDNIEQHIEYYHKNKVPKERGTTSTSCRFCGAYISQKTNLRCHIKIHHPEHYTPPTTEVSDSLNEIVKSSSELTREFFSTPKKFKYMEYVRIVSMEDDNVGLYQCLLCLKDPKKTNKLRKQVITNGGTSNIRKHLSSAHPVEFRKFEDSDSSRGYL